jgi:hypothetical protein
MEEIENAVLIAHLNLILAIQTIDGVLSAEEIRASVDIVSQAMQMDHQQVGAMMQPLSEHLAGLSDDERDTLFGNSIDFIALHGNAEFKKMCYVHYEVIAQADGLVDIEKAMLRLILTKWGLPESLEQMSRSKAFKVGYKANIAKSKAGCAIILGALLTGSLSACVM